MSPVIAGAMAGWISGFVTSMISSWVQRRFFRGLKGSRWCRYCWAFARVMMDGSDVCLNCGDSDWKRQEQQARDLAMGERMPDDGRRSGMLPGRAPLSIVKKRDP